MTMTAKIAKPVAAPLGPFRLRRWIPAWLGNTLALLAVWQAASLLLGRNAAGAHTVPSLMDIAGAAKLLGNYWPGGLGLGRTAAGEALTWQAAIYAFVYNPGLTILRTISGLALGACTGIGLGTAVSWSATLRKTVAFPAHLSRMLPLLALVPLFNLWFGNTELAVVLFVALVTFCVMFPTTLSAIGSVPGYYEEYARSLGASSLRVYLTVVLRAAQPRINIGLVLAHGFAWSAVIAAEFLGMQFGLGRIVLMAQEFNQFSLLALAGFITVAWAVISTTLLAHLLGRFTRWS